jgi:hypothetical protein
MKMTNPIYRFNQASLRRERNANRLSAVVFLIGLILLAGVVGCFGEYVATKELAHIQAER